MSLLKLFVIVSALTLLVCTDGVSAFIDLKNMPSIDSFYAWLFNTTAASNIDGIVKEFDFFPVERDDIKFLWFTGNPKIFNSTVILNYPYNNDNYQTIDATKPMKIIIHGWRSTGLDPWIRTMAQNYRRRYGSDYNIITVDWSSYSRCDYLSAASRVRGVGEKIGEFILDLIADKTNNDQALLENIHIVGHSLGAHIAGFAGKTVLKVAKQRIGRITGLDAAAPLFEYPIRRPQQFRLDEDDAVFVDGIHTNIKFLGFKTAYGTADYYMENGGPIQPGCINLLNIFDALWCSHSKAHDYFYQSIVDDKFEALACLDEILYLTLLCDFNKKAFMGENADPKATGSFYLRRSSAYPFGFFKSEEKRLS